MSKFVYSGEHPFWLNVNTDLSRKYMHQVAIIGGGACGIIAAKQLTDIQLVKID